MPYKKDENGHYITPAWQAHQFSVFLMETVYNQVRDIDLATAAVVGSRTYEELNRLDSKLYKKTPEQILQLFTLEITGNIQAWEKKSRQPFHKT